MAQQLPQIHSVHSSQRRPAHGSARPAAPSLLAGALGLSCRHRRARRLRSGGVLVGSPGDADYNFTRQLGGVAVGQMAMVALWAFDYRRLSFEPHHGAACHQRGAHPLPHIPGLGTDAGMGAKSWIKIGMQVQPGEFAKVTVVLFAASLLARYQGTLDDWREYCKVLGMLLVPFAAIMTKPDLGTGLVYLAISAVVLIMGGAKGRYLLITLIAGIAAIAAVFAVDELLKYQQSDGTWEYRLLKNYQRSRLLVFLNPSGFPVTATTSPRPRSPSAAVALFGKGHRQRHAVDPRLSARGPHGLHLLRSGRGVRVRGRHGAHRPVRPAHRGVPLHRPARRQPLRHAHRHGRRRHVALQILENIGMDCGLMPITGIPLPFVSYGSSFMVVNFALIGLIGSVYSHTSTQSGFARTPSHGRKAS